MASVVVSTLLNSPLYSDSCDNMPCLHLQSKTQIEWRDANSNAKSMPHANSRHTIGLWCTVLHAVLFCAVCGALMRCKDTKQHRKQHDAPQKARHTQFKTQDIVCPRHTIASQIAQCTANSTVPFASRRMICVLDCESTRHTQSKTQIVRRDTNSHWCGNNLSCTHVVQMYDNHMPCKKNAEFCASLRDATCAFW